MTKHISDSERLTIAMLNRKETELAETRRELNRLQNQLRVMTDYASDLRSKNKLLCEQINNLFLYHKHHA